MKRRRRHVHRSQPLQDVVGPNSPVVRSVDWIDAFLQTDPSPGIPGQEAKSCGLLAANHLLRLLESCGNLNVLGYHSVAVVLLRSLEDALDVFSAVVQVPGAAARWQKDDLKPSDAAKMLVDHLGNPTVEGPFLSPGTTLADYRRGLRNEFNRYSHSSYQLTLWDLYLRVRESDSRTGATRGSLEINRSRLKIDANAHAIDAHLTAHLLEFFSRILTGYADAQLFRWQNTGASALIAELDQIMKQHTKHGCQDVREPAELRRLDRPQDGMRSN